MAKIENIHCPICTQPISSWFAKKTITFYIYNNEVNEDPICSKNVFQGPLWGVWRNVEGSRAAAAPVQHLHQPPARSTSGETSELVQSGEVAAGRWQRERGSMVISIFPTRGLAELWPCSRLNTDSQWGETFTYWTKNLSALYPFYCTQVRPLVGLVNYSLSDLLITLSLTNLLTPHCCQSLLLRKAFYRTDPSPIISWPCHSQTYVFETEIV